MQELSSSASLSEEVLNNWEVEKESLENALLDSRTKLKALKNANDTLNQENKSLIANYEQLKVVNKQATEINDEKEVLQVEIQNLREEINTLNGRLLEYEELNGNLIKSNDAKVIALKEELHALTDDYDKVSTKKDELEVEIRNKCISVESLENDRAHLKDEISNYCNKLKGNEESQQQLENRLSSLQTENAQLLHEISANSEILNKSEDLKQEIESQKRAVSDLKDAKMQLEAANSNLMEEIQKANVANNAMKTRINQIEVESQTHNSKLMEAEQFHKSEYEQLVIKKDLEISMIKEERNNYLEQAEKLKLEMLQSASTSQENDSGLVNENLELKRKLKDVDIERNQLLQTVMERQREVSSLQSEVHKLTNVVGMDKDTISTLQADLIKRQEEVTIKQNAVIQLEYALKKYDNDISAMRIENEGLTNKLAVNEQKHQMELERLRQHLVQVRHHM